MHFILGYRHQRIWSLSANRKIWVVMDKNLNFSAVRCPIELKLGGDLGLVSQISGHVLVSRFDYFLYCKQTKEQENRENRGFTKLAISPFQVRLI
jgi:hypothetical protein